MSKSLLENLKNYAQVYTQPIWPVLLVNLSLAKESSYKQILHLKKFHNGYLYLSQDKIYWMVRLPFRLMTVKMNCMYMLNMNYMFECFDSAFRICGWNHQK